MMKNGRPAFPKGAKVEVSSDEDGFAGAWFEAIVVRSGKGKKRLFVEYESFVDDNDHSKLLRESVNAGHVRPRPPPDDPLPEFRPGDSVEAYFNDGWWPGEISKALDSFKFVVKFPGSEDEDIGRSQLRARRDWVRGRWVSPLELVKTEIKCEGTVLTTKGLIETGKREIKHEETMIEYTTEHLIELGKTEMKFCKGILVEVSSDEEGFSGAWYVGTIVEVYGKDQYLVEYESLRTDDESQPLREIIDAKNIRPVPPDVFKIEKFCLLEEIDALYNDGWWVGVISKVLKDARYIVYFRQTMEEMEFRHSDLRLHLDWCDGKWVRASEALQFFDQ